MVISRSVRIVAALFAAGIIVGGAWYGYRLYQTHRLAVATDFYAAALRNANIRTQVSVGTKTYNVYGGKVFFNNAIVQGAAAYPALRVAYAQALAERRPLLDISGVDPDALEAAANRLAAVQDQLAALQASSTKATYLRALYPIHFLTALAQLERARLAFIASPSDASEARYQANLAAAAAAGAEDIAAFAKVLAFLAPAASTTVETNTIVEASLGGPVTATGLQRAPQAEVTRMREVSDAVAQLAACTTGDTARCLATVPQLPIVDPVASTTPGTTTLALVDASKPLVQQALYGSSKTRVVALSSSVCLASLPGPYYFLIPNSAATGTLPFFYLGDVFLHPVDPHAATSSYSVYMAQTYGASYLIENPTQFTACPEVGADYGRVRAMDALAQFAQAHPGIEPTLRAPLVGKGPLLESDAVAYLQALLARESAAPDQYLPEALRLALMYRDRAAGLETIVSRVAALDESRLAGKNQDIDFDLTLRAMYLTRSAMETLYLANNPLAGSTTVSRRGDISDPENQARYFGEVERYSDLRTTLLPAAVAHDLAAYASFELR